MLLTLLAVHAAAFAGLLVLSRRDVMRLDDAGEWVARRVPQAPAADRVAV